MIIAGSLDNSTSSVRKLPIAWWRNILVWSDSALPWMTLLYPVAKIPCQNRVIFSCKGAVVVAIRYSQFSPGARGPIIPDSSGWNRLTRYSLMRCSSFGASNSSTVASYPLAAVGLQLFPLGPESGPSQQMRH